MKQAWHIFVKDVRRFYAEILASLAITVAFVEFYPQAWGAPVGIRLYSWVPTALVVLVMLSWFVLIARAMHAESLIGDKQFWVTRPYRWGSLLTAKVLFAFVFVVLPFFASQCLMLREAKFHPFATMPGLLFNTTMATGIIVLPLMLLASITKNFPKLLLGLLLVTMYAAALGYTSALMPANSSPSDDSWWGFIAAVVVMGAVLTFQYATRRTRVARALVVAVGLVIAVMVLLVSNDGDVDKLYAKRQAGGMSGVQIVIQPKSGGVQPDPDSTKEVELVVPLGVSGIEAKTAIKADYAKVAIDGPAGQHWESHWQATYMTWLPGEPDDVVRLKINRKFYERMKGVPVTIKLSLALMKLQAGTGTSVVLPEGEFRTPGGSICSIKNSFMSEMSCRSPLRGPALMLVAARPSKTECGSAARIPGDAAPRVGWIGSLDTDPAEFDLTAVSETTVYFGWTSAAAEDGYFCPGSPLAFVTYTPVERGQATASIQANGLEHFTAKMMM